MAPTGNCAGGMCNDESGLVADVLAFGEGALSEGP